MNDQDSGVNTILLVLILALLVGGIVWFLRGSGDTAQQSTDTANLEVTIPTGADEGNASNNDQ